MVYERGHLTVLSHCNRVFLAPSSMLAIVIMQLSLKASQVADPMEKLNLPLSFLYLPWLLVA